MKTKHLYSLIIALVFSLAIFSCEIDDDLLTLPDECDEDGWGQLSVENKSVGTVQRINIDGTNYGTLDPGYQRTIELPVGKFTLEFVGISGGGGCTPAEVTIPDCGVVGRACSY